MLHKKLFQPIEPSKLSVLEEVIAMFDLLLLILLPCLLLLLPTPHSPVKTIALVQHGGHHKTKEVLPRQMNLLLGGPPEVTLRNLQREGLYNLWRAWSKFEEQKEQGKDKKMEMFYTSPIVLSVSPTEMYMILAVAQVRIGESQGTYTRSLPEGGTIACC